MDTTESEQPFALTWAATSPLSFEQDPVAEIWAPAGKWPVTPAAGRPKKTATWFLEPAASPGLDEAAADIATRIWEGTWLMVAGAPAPGLDRWQPHLLMSVNFIDPPTRLLVVDFHGLTPDAGEDISKPKCFGQPIVDTLRARFAVIGIHSMARAKMVLVAMPSTGAKLNSRGEPARGCARFRALFELDVALPAKRHGVLLNALRELDGFHCLDVKGKPSGVCIDIDCGWPGRGAIVARPVLPKGMKDPIAEPVQTFEGETPCVDVRALMRELRPGEPLPRDPRYANVMSKWRAPWLESLVRDLSPWSAPLIELGHAIWGASGGEPWGRDIWMRWRAERKPNCHADSEKDWNALDDGVSGIEDLLGWAKDIEHAQTFASLISLYNFPVVENAEINS